MATGTNKSEESKRPAKYKGRQNIYAKNGDIVFEGGWDSRALFKAVNGEKSEYYWVGRTVLDIGANTSGLSIELARRGAAVTAIEPDPFKNTRFLALEVIKSLIASENLNLALRDEGLFDAHTLGRFDVVMCLGLVYHFRDQQFVLDYLSTLDCSEVIVSNQTHPGDELKMVNRMDPSVPVPTNFWSTYPDPLSGWHPTRPMFERMLRHAGFEDVVPLTDPSINYPAKPLPGVTNSAYYQAKRMRSVDPVTSRYLYLPR
jgi:SAM-dependent methyltransferase